MIDELRAALAAHDPAGEPVPALRAPGPQERPERPPGSAKPPPGPASRLGPRRAAAPAPSARPAPLARTQSSPPRLPLPSRVVDRGQKPAPAREPRRPAKSPERGPSHAQQSSAHSPESSSVVGPSTGQVPTRIPYQELMSSLHELDLRMARSPPRDQGAQDKKAGGGPGRGAAGESPNLGHKSVFAARPRPQSPEAKRAPGRSYLDRLLRQLREEQAAQRGATHEQELLSSGTKSLPQEHWRRTSSRGMSS